MHFLKIAYNQVKVIIISLLDCLLGVFPFSASTEIRQNAPSKATDRRDVMKAS